VRILAIPANKQEVGIKRAFLNFMEWFLKERYLRHLLEDGHMDNKKAYLLYKNRFLPGAIEVCNA
jgi:hypothetical protein